MKRVFVAALTAACVFVPAAAMADVQSLTINSGVEFIDGNRVRVSGTITCDAGDRFRVGVPTGGLKNNVGTINKRSGPDTGNCSGSSQTWRVIVNRKKGPAYESGQTGTVKARAQTGTPGGTDPNDTGKASAAMTIN